MTDTLAGDVRTSPRLRQAEPLTPFAAGLHRLAAFITTHRLPPADLVLYSATSAVIADLSDTAGMHVEGAVAVWAKALGATVTEQPLVQGGRMFRYFEADGWTEDLVFVRVVGRQLIAEAVA